MQLSRSRKIVLIGVALLAVGLAGRASADTTRPQPGSASAAATAKPVGKKPAHARAAKKPATKKPAAKAPTAKSATAKRPGSASAATTIKNVGGKKVSGPAGSRLTTGSKAVALTFDDGPDPAQTPRILRLLAQQHVHATFCLVGENVQRHPEMVRKIVAGGHTLCNHTWNHSLKIGKDPVAKIRADLQRTNTAILKAAPKAKVKYFRAPGGNFTPRLVAVARQMGMSSLYWKVDPRDWDHPEGETSAQHTQRVIWQVCHRTHRGAIVLSHDYAQPDTIAAYRKIIPWLKKRYQLIAMP